MNLYERLEELNKKLGSKITMRVAIDKMYNKYCIEFLNEEQEVFFTKGEEYALSDPELYAYETVMNVENRYKELYRK